MLKSFLMDSKEFSVNEKLKLLVESLDGAEKTNEGLSLCEDSEAMLDILQEFSSQLKLGLTRDDLKRNPPIRDK